MLATSSASHLLLGLLLITFSHLLLALLRLLLQQAHLVPLHPPIRRPEALGPETRVLRTQSIQLSVLANENAK